MVESSENQGYTSQEWSLARSLITWYEDKIHDLRKYGFSLVAALLTASALTTLLSNNLAESARGVLIILICALLIAVFLFDRNYQFYQQVAARRAKILESEMNIKLSEEIAVWYYKQKMYVIMSVLYIIFIWITCALGFYITPTYWQYIAGAGATLIICVFSVYDHYYPQKVGQIYKKIVSKESIESHKHILGEYIGDWAIDKISCKSGETIKFTLTNTGGSVNPSKKEIIFDKDAVVLYLIDDLGNRTDIPANSNVTIPPNFNYSWVWPTIKNEDSRIYTVHPSDLCRLKRTIYVKGGPKETPKESES